MQSVLQVSDAAAVCWHAAEGRGSAVAGGIVFVGLWTKMARGEQGGYQCVKNPFLPRAAESACGRSRGSNPAHLRMPGPAVIVSRAAT
jgi:hypothetical protein